MRRQIGLSYCKYDSPLCGEKSTCHIVNMTPCHIGNMLVAIPAILQIQKRRLIEHKNGGVSGSKTGAPLSPKSPLAPLKAACPYISSLAAKGARRRRAAIRRLFLYFPPVLRDRAAGNLYAALREPFGNFPVGGLFIRALKHLADNLLYAFFRLSLAARAFSLCA